MDVRVGPKEGWGPKNWWLWIVALEKILESSLDYKEIKPVNPKGNQLWIFIRRTDAEAEAPIFWPPDAQSQLIGKDPDNWGKLKAKGEDGGRKWMNWLNGHESEQTLGDGEGQGSLACSPWDPKSRTQLSNGTTATAWVVSTWRLRQCPFMFCYSLNPK